MIKFIYVSSEVSNKHRLFVAPYRRLLRTRLLLIAIIISKSSYQSKYANIVMDIHLAYLSLTSSPIYHVPLDEKTSLITINFLITVAMRSVVDNIFVGNFNLKYNCPVEMFIYQFYVRIDRTR